MLRIEKAFQPGRMGKREAQPPTSPLKPARWKIVQAQFPVAKVSCTILGEPMHRIALQIGAETLTLETGRMAKQANGSVFATLGESAVIATTCCGSEPVE
ncbi:MAG: hypothetical protein ACR2PY_00835, partial [Salinispira sp.]